MTTCTSGQNAYVLDLFTANGGATPDAACASLIGVNLGGNYATGSSVVNGRCILSGMANPSYNGDWGGITSVCTPSPALIVPVGGAAPGISCGTACTVTLVYDFQLPLLSLSVADGIQLSFAVMLVWSVGFFGRMLVRAINTDSHVGDE